MQAAKKSIEVMMRCCPSAIIKGDSPSELTVNVPKKMDVCMVGDGVFISSFKNIIEQNFALIFTPLVAPLEGWDNKSTLPA